MLRTQYGIYSYHGKYGANQFSAFPGYRQDIWPKAKNARKYHDPMYFALPNHNVLEGRIIRCSNNNGLYIVF